MTSLQTQAVSGVKWASLRTLFIAAIGPVMQIVKARYLTPEDFAYISIIMISIGLFYTLENFGVSQAIIQKDALDEQEASSLFFFNISLAGFFGMILYFISPLIAGFFELPKLNYYLKITSLIVVFGGPGLLFRALLEKYLLFKALSILEMARNLLMLGLVTVLLITDYGVLGVIYSNMIATLFFTIAVAVLGLKNNFIKIYPYFSFRKIIPFLRFGIFVSGKQAMTFIAHRIDEVIIGYFLAPEILGIYYFGKNMLEQLRGLITQSFAKVLFPVFSRLKNDSQKLSSAYIKTSSYIAFISFPVFIGIAVTAHLFVPIIFGEQWVESVIVFQVFSLALMFMVLTANVSTALLYSVNKPDVVFYIDIATNIIYFITLFIFVPKGLTAVLVVYSLYIIYKTLSLQYYANKQLLHSFTGYFSYLKKPFIFSMFMAVVVMLYQGFGKTHFQEIWLFAGSVVIGIMVYISLGLLYQRDIINELKSLLTKGAAAS